MCRWILILVFCLLGGLCPADTVRVKNGWKYTGLIQEEDDRKIVMEVGGGTITIARQTIVAIERTSTREAAQVKEQWQRQYFLNAKYVPEGYGDLAEAFRQVQARRESAVQARLQIKALQAEERQLRGEVDAVYRAILAVNQQLQSMQPADNVSAYNALISSNNSLQALAALKANARNKNAEEIRRAETLTSEYIMAFSGFSRSLAQRQAEAQPMPATNAGPTFLARLAGVVDGLRGEVSINQIQAERVGTHLVVTAVLADGVPGRFIVDTGAASVTISAALARKLGLAMQPDQEIKTMLADGKEVSAYRTVLSSVAVGRDRVENVEAVIFPESPAPAVDGLLGMTFLGQFAVQLDSSGGKLILHRFAAE